MDNFVRISFSEKFEIVSHQYGSLSLKNHREMLDGGNGMTVLSIDLNQDEDEIIIEEELPGYTRSVSKSMLASTIKYFACGGNFFHLLDITNGQSPAPERCFTIVNHNDF